MVTSPSATSAGSTVTAFCICRTAPDEDFGEALAAHVDADLSPGLTEAAVRDHAGARLSGYMVPKVVVFDDDLSREETGKISKRRIRERYWHRAGRNI
jgi:long-chain acyl-CoA synthetase